MILSKTLEKSIDLDSEIDRFIKSNQLEKLLLIVPTNRKSRYLKKEIISLSSSKAVSAINIETIGTFATKIFLEAQKRVRNVLSESASAVLLRQSFQETKTKYFANYSGEIPSGTLERLKNVISEYKRHGITPEILKAEGRNLSPAEKNKAEDIANIYSIYQDKIKQLNVYEIGDIYSAVTSNSLFDFSEKFRNLYPEVNLIIINGFDEFTTPEIEIIDLISSLSNSRLYLIFDYYKYNPLIFSHLEKCYKKLLQKGFNEIEDKSVAGYYQFRLLVRENLFRKLPLPEVKNRFENEITIIRTKNRESEIALIAKEIKNLITGKKTEPHKICVAFNLIQKYSPAIRDLFSLYGLPFNLTDRFSLSNSSPVTALINFLEILENDYFYKNIFRALSSGYININGVDLSGLLKASRELKILSGYERWTTALEDALNHVTADDPFEKSSVKKESFKRALKSLNRINHYLKNFKGKMTIKEFKEKLTELIFKLNLPVYLINYENKESFLHPDIIEKNIKALNTFLEITNEILDLLEEEFSHSEKFGLKFFLNHLRTAVVSARYNIKEKPGYGVQVTTLNEIRGIEFDYLFICGLCDGDLPTRYTPEIFLSGQYYKYEEEHQTEERYHFYQALCSWKKGLYLTYPSAEERKELVQSNFLTGFKNLFTTKEKTENDYEDTLYSKEELLKLAGYTDLSLLKQKYSNDEISINTELIEQAKQINYIRNNEMHGNSPFVGDIYGPLNDSEKEWLSDLKFKQYSVSQLETYAKCPYKYFAERILKLEEIDEPTEEVEALEMGSLLHNVFYEFYKELKDKKIILFQCSEGEFNFARELLFSIAEKKIDEANFRSPLSFYEKEKILGINNKKENSILYEFLKKEREEKDGFVPEFLEVSFGKMDDEKLPEEIKNLKARGVSIRGKIDRVDINNDQKEFRVIDYKLGGIKPSSQDLAEGISLQLPLYMFAAKELIKAQLNKDYKAESASIYSLKFKKDDFGRKPINILSHNYSSAENIINICLDAVGKYVTSISAGKFHLTQLNDRESKVCRFCSFRSVCRIEETN